MTVRAGYDVVETMYLEESTFGTTPSDSETWKPTWLTTSFDPRQIPTFKNKIGLGRAWASDFVFLKEYSEFTLEQEMLAKQSNPAFEWTDFYLYIISDGNHAANPVAITRRVKSFSFGAKLDLATDEFWWLKGCKLTEFEIRGTVDEPLTARILGIAQYADYDVTDYVTGNQSRQALPTSAYLKFADCDIEITPDGGNKYSVFDSINNFSLTVTREILRRRANATTKTLYGAFAERTLRMSLRINKDFESRTELEQFLDQTEFDVDVSIPTGSGGRKIVLSGGKWREQTTPHREIDLIALDLRADFTNLNVYTL